MLAVENRHQGSRLVCEPAGLAALSHTGQVKRVGRGVLVAGAAVLGDC